ncbi:MAG: MraY family glycosyltransferase [Chloroflexia bacterium]
MLYLPAFTIACALSLVLTHIVGRVAFQRSWLDQPSPRRVHSAPTPRLGGAAMFGSFAVCLLVLTAAGRLPTYTTLAVLTGAASLTLVGLVDDLWELDVGTKFRFKHADVAVTVVAFDLSMRTLTLTWIGSIHLEGTIAGYGITIFWILGMTNTVNFADGIDGLAAGLAFVFAAVLFAVGLRVGQEQLLLYAAVLGGAVLGFLRYNFPPARIFMGDSGAYFLGYTMGALSVIGNAKIALGLLVMGLPITDVAYSIIRRYRTGAAVQLPDKQHLHHRLVTLGLSQRSTAAVFYLLALGFGSAALIPTRDLRAAALVVLGLIALALIWGVDRRMAALPPERIARDEPAPDK